MKTDYITCRFCDWKRQRWIKNKKGKNIHGQKALLQHVTFEHFDEYMEIVKFAELPIDNNKQ